MMQMTVKMDLEKVKRQLEDRLQKQIPFAAAKALSDTAKNVQKVVNAEIDRVFDRPVPFTQKAIGMTYANKATLRAKVFVKSVQAQYLGLQIAGGVRTPKNRALVLPGKGLNLNKYGNIPKGKIKALLARPDTFSGTVQGIAGIWQRTNHNKKVKLLVLYKPQATYKRRFPFADISSKEIERKLQPNFRAALQAAIASAR